MSKLRQQVSQLLPHSTAPPKPKMHGLGLLHEQPLLPQMDAAPTTGPTMTPMLVPELLELELPPPSLGSEEKLPLGEKREGGQFGSTTSAPAAVREL